MTRPSPVVHSVLGNLRLQCNKCRHVTTAQEYRQHKESRCEGHQVPVSPSRISARDILQCPTTAPVLPVEKRVAEHLVRRMLTETEGGILKIPTQGLVNKCTIVMHVLASYTCNMSPPILYYVLPLNIAHQPNASVLW